MKKFALLVSFVFAAGVAFAQDAPSSETKTPAAAMTDKADKADKMSHDVEAEVVAVDATAKTITIKAEPANKTVPVEGKATAQLTNVKPGDKVLLSCRDNAQGEHQAVVAIKPASEAKKAEPKN